MGVGNSLHNNKFKKTTAEQFKTVLQWFFGKADIRNPLHQSERVPCYPFCTATSRFVFLNHKNAPMQIKTETKEPKAVASPIGNRVAGNNFDIR